MKKILSVIFILSLLFAFNACAKKEPVTDVPASGGNEANEVKELKVGFCPGPYSDLWKTAIAPQLEKKGYSISYVEFSDYVQPNLALANKEINVNMFQHSIYLNNFSKQHNLSLSLVTEIPTVGMGIWSRTTSSIAETKKAAVVTIPNDETNMARGLRVLEAAGLIKLKDGIDKSKAILDDIGENPLELKIVPTEAAQIPRTLDSADLAVVNGNFAISAGLNPADSLYNEVLGEGYVNVIAVRTEDLDKQFVKDIKEAATNDEFKAIVDDPENGFSGFQKPAGW